MTDVMLRHTANGGEISVTNGRFELDDSPATAAYLSLFGGNEADAGSDATAAKQWWGNLGEADASRHLRSETQHLLRGLPAVTSNLERVRNAIERDLAWMVELLGAQIEVVVRIPAPRRIEGEISIAIDGNTTTLRFTEKWGIE